MVRKTHTKSRKGCVACKRRHVKCDEKRPVCSACSRLDIECEWTGGMANGHPSPDLSNASNSSSDGLSLPDLKLLHFWTMHTASTCCCKSQVHMWQDSLVEMGFRHPFYLHGVLAVAATHKATIYPHEAEELSKQSSAHMNIAIRELRNQLENPDPASINPVFALSGLLVVHSLGVAQLNPPTDPIADLCHWMRLIKGVQATVAQHRMRIMTSEVADIITNIESVVDGHRTPCSISEILKLKELVNQTQSLEPPRREAYLHAIDELQKVYGDVHRIIKGNGDNLATEVTLSWIALIHPMILDLISDRDELALVILAHFALLLHLQDTTWWTRGWAKWTIDASRSHLGPQCLPWTAWPLAQLQNPPTP